MVITITLPAPGDPCGWGYNVQLSTDIIGPFPIDTRWEVRIEPLEDPSILIQYGAKLWTTNTDSVTIGQETDGSTQALQAQPQVVAGDPARLVARLVSPTTGLLDTGSTNIVYEPQNGIPWGLVTTGSVPVGGGFTEADRIVLMGTQKGLSDWIIWDLVGELVPDLLEFIRGKIGTKYSKVQYTPDSDGAGNLSRPAVSPFFRWVGIEWEIVGRPAGFGLDEGNPPTTEIDWGQLSYMRQNADASFSASETFYERRVFAQWVWGTEEPDHVAFFIMPGLVVRFFALIALEPAAQFEPGQPSASVLRAP